MIKANLKYGADAKLNKTMRLTKRKWQKEKNREPARAESRMSEATCVRGAAITMTLVESTSETRRLEKKAGIESQDTITLCY